MNIISIVSLIASCVSAIAAIAAIFAALYVSYRAELPDVILYLDHDQDHSSMNLILENFGKGVARDIKIDDFDPEMVQESFRDLVMNSFPNKGVSMLAPGSKRITALAVGEEMKNLANKSCAAVISYAIPSWPFSNRIKRVESSFSLDYYSFSGSLYSQSDKHQMKVAVDKIAKSAVSIDKSLKIAQHNSAAKL